MATLLLAKVCDRVATVAAQTRGSCLENKTAYLGTTVNPRHQLIRLTNRINCRRDHRVWALRGGGAGGRRRLVGVQRRRVLPGADDGECEPYPVRVRVRVGRATTAIEPCQVPARAD